MIREFDIKKYIASKASYTAIATCCLFMSQAAMADDSAKTDSSGVSNGDIVVTAQRRAQSVNKVPMSITALDNKALEDKQISTMSDLAFASPGIRAAQQQGVTRIFIRGIGLNSFSAGADPSIAFYADGVYVGRPTAQASSFYDVQRIEVLRGPQGALYGRNATGGAVNVLSQAPERTAGGYVNLTAGNYGLFEGEGAVNVPLSANGDWRSRVSAHIVNRGGYGYDYTANHEINDTRSQSVRGQLQYENGTGLNVRLIADYHHENDYNNYTMSFGAYPGYALQGVVGTVDPNNNVLKGIYVDGTTQNAATALQGKTNVREGENVTLNATIPLAEGLSLNSITGYRNWDRYNGTDSDGTSAGLGTTGYTENASQISQEMVLNWNLGNLNVVSGLSYYHEKIDNYVFVPFVQYGLQYIQSGYMKIDAYAAYAQATYSILPKLRVTAGGRYSSETRNEVGTFTLGSVSDTSGKSTWSKFTPKFGIEADLAPDVMAYASATNGFKSGTYNIGQVNPAIQPETIWAYEAGVNGKFFDRKLQLHAAYFHYDYSNLQVNKIIGIATVTTNAASAKLDGFEISGTAKVIPGLTLEGSFNYIHARFSDFNSTNPLIPNGPYNTVGDPNSGYNPAYLLWAAANQGINPQFGGVGGVEQLLAGNALPNSPKYSATGSIQYEYSLPGAGKLTTRADLEWSSRIQFSEFNDVNLSQAPVAKLNALMRYDSPSLWSLTFWGKNLTNATVKANELVTIQLWGYPRYGSIEPPRTFGATLGLRF